MQAPNIDGVDFVPIPVRDLDAARDFYGRVLDLPCSSLWQRGDEPAMGAEFEAGPVTLSLVLPEALGQEFAPLTMPLALRVPDVAAAKAALVERGVEFRADDVDSGVCTMAFFHDPDGNPLMLHHRYAPLPPRRDLRHS
jgi:catechol 2,3-dioxygenase-like lactoylglutathione lyase family enzyme